MSDVEDEDFIVIVEVGEDVVDWSVYLSGIVLVL